MNENNIENNQISETIGNIKDNETVLTMTDDETKAAQRRITELSAEIDDERAVKQTLEEIRQIRENKAAEFRNNATYQETKTLEAVINTIRKHRDIRTKTKEQVETIMHDDRYSDSHRTELVNEQNRKLRERTNQDRETTIALMGEIIKARQEFDRNFYADPERFDTANRIITALKAAGNNLSPKDFTNLVYPLYGDSAAVRYVSAAVNDVPMRYKGALRKMIVDPDSMFSQSMQQIYNLYAGNYTAYDVERLLIAEAEALGISTTITDYSKPIYSQERNKSLMPEMDQDELIQLVRSVMKR